MRVYYWQDPIDYAEAYSIQKSFWSQKVAGQVTDFLLLLEHPPTFTIGKSGKLENLLLTRERLSREGIPLYFADRGGDITYHGPGQLVAYPIIDLRERGKDIHKYIRDLQEAVIRTLGDFSIEAGRDRKHVGVWVGDDKIAAIGVRVSRWIAMHGLALNVNPVMEHFTYINPCGIIGRGVTSIAKLLSHDVPIAVVARGMANHFADVFDTDIRWESTGLSRSD